MKNLYNSLVEERERYLENINKVLSALTPLEQETFSDKANLWFWGGGVVLSGLTREEVLNGVKLLGGKFHKSFESSTGTGVLCYCRNKGGIQVELKTTDLPSSCKLEKKFVIIPAQPERVKEEYQIVCTQVENE